MRALRLHKWPWLEAGVIPLASALMRVAWLTPLIRLLLHSDVVAPQGARFPAWLVLGLLGSANLLARRRSPVLGTCAGLLAVGGSVAYAFRLDLAHPAAWWASLAASQADISEGFPAVLVVVLAAGGIWWRGLTAVWHDYRELFVGFVVGMTVLGLLMLAVEPASWERRGLNVWGATAGFILSALVSLALLAVYEMLSWERFRGRGPGLSRYWVTALGSVMAGILALGWGVGQAIASDMTHELLRALRPVGQVAEKGLELFLLAAGYLAFEVFGGLLEILKRIIERTLGALLIILRLLFSRGAEAVGQAAARSGASDQAARVFFWGMLLGMLAFLSYLALRRFRPLYVEGAIEKREFIWSTALLLGQIRSVLRGLRRPPAPTAFLQMGEAEEARRAIRRLYREMLARLSHAGHARPPNLTPRAYEQTVSDLLRGERQALHILTDAYLVARYSPEVPSDALVREAGQAMRRIEALLGGQ
ncbi:MAG: DUF4129 domain-containing protein [Chloroflexi bacterium]|nr:DUF4129 domain-containing protein [Chloroflexota bacterium]